MTLGLAVYLGFGLIGLAIIGVTHELDERRWRRDAEERRRAGTPAE